VPARRPFDRSYSSVWIVYLNLRLAADGNALVLLLFNYRPQVAFRAPLTDSSSPLDFWSRRWNMMVRGLFHRTIFTPMRNRGVSAAPAHTTNDWLARTQRTTRQPVVSACVQSRPPCVHSQVPVQAAALSSFVVSGLFHEYAFAPGAGYATLGCELAFFLIQAVFCTIEVALLKGSPVGRALGRCPQWAKAAGTTLMLVPFSPFFMAPLVVAGTLEAMLGNVPRVRFVAACADAATACVAWR
jgi:hypothetical protein